MKANINNKELDAIIEAYKFMIGTKGTLDRVLTSGYMRNINILQRTILKFNPTIEFDGIYIKEKQC